MEDIDWITYKTLFPGLGNKAKNVLLYKLHVYTLEELKLIDWRSILKLYHVGEKTVKEIVLYRLRNA